VIYFNLQKANIIFDKNCTYTLNVFFKLFIHNSHVSDDFIIIADNFDYRSSITIEIKIVSDLCLTFNGHF